MKKLTLAAVAVASVLSFSTVSTVYAQESTLTVEQIENIQRRIDGLLNIRERLQGRADRTNNETYRNRLLNRIARIDSRLEEFQVRLGIDVPGSQIFTPEEEQSILNVLSAAGFSLSDVTNSFSAGSLEEFLFRRPGGPDGGFNDFFNDALDRSFNEIRAERARIFEIAEQAAGDSAPTDPAPTDPAPTDPPPTDPAPTDPPPTDPAPTDPTPTDPAPTDPAPTDPPPTDPAPTDPTPTDPAPTDPAPTDPAPVDPTTAEGQADILNALAAIGFELNDANDVPNTFSAVSLNEFLFRRPFGPNIRFNDTFNFQLRRNSAEIEAERARIFVIAGEAIANGVLGG